MKITRVQAEALATLATKLRPDWRHAGVMAAIEKCTTEEPCDIARALVNLAADSTVQTPGLLHRGGPHWLRPDGEKPARRGDHAVRCTRHPINVEPCPQCRADPDHTRGCIRFCVCVCVCSDLRIHDATRSLSLALGDVVAGARLQ